MKNSTSKFLLAITASLFLMLANFTTAKIEKPFLNISKQQSTLNFNNSILNFFHLGQKRLISSILWISTILESDHEHYKARDLNSWMFLRFNTISQLEPKFYEIYAFGGPYLSIIKDDLDGASAIYKKGLEIYPEDFLLLRNASFHFYFEQRNFDDAFPILKKLSIHPKAPLFVVTSLARLNAQDGQIEDALEALNSFQKFHDVNTLIGSKIYQYRYSLRSQIDLECLNSKNNKACNKLDLDGNPYFLSQQKFKAIKNWEPLKIKPRK